jgi:hypothetical protein
MTVPGSDGGIGGLTVMAFESRRASELESLIRRHGGVPLVVPSMREVPLQDDAALELLRELEADRINLVIALTGVALRTLAERCPPERLAAALARTTLVARGPKPIADDCGRARSRGRVGRPRAGHARRVDRPGVQRSAATPRPTRRSRA